MSHERTHQPFETIHSADIDRWLLLIQNGIVLGSTGIRTAIHGHISYSDLSPELQALFAVTQKEDRFVGDGVNDTFPLTTPPISTTLTAFLNGQFLDFTTDYTVSGSNIILAHVPDFGDIVTIRYGTSAALELTKMGSFVLPDMNILEMNTDNFNLFTYGTNKILVTKEVNKFRPIDLLPLNVPVDVSSGQPFKSATVMADGWLWAVGATAGTNNITRIDPNDMSSTVIPVSADPLMFLRSITADPLNVYAFIHGGVPIYNVIARIPPSGPISTVINVGTLPAVITNTDIALNSAGFLFLCLTDLGVVRKYDVGTGALLKTFTYTHPVRIIAMNSDIYVLDDVTNKLHKISAADVPSTVTTFLMTPSNMYFDGNDLWVSYADRLRKLDNINGLLLQEIYPEAGFNIQGIGGAIGSIWTSYSNDSGVTDPNITRLFPGLPGI